MNTNIITLNNSQLNTNLRLIEKNGNPWFAAQDVKQATGSKDSTANFIERLDDDEKGVCLTHTLGGKQKLAIISESGLYTLILRSRDAVNEGTPAHTFRKWVTNEVLPAIRRDGFYSSQLSPAAQEAQALEYRLQASKLRAEAEALELKAKKVHHLSDAVPIIDWLKTNSPDLTAKQRANYSRPLKHHLRRAKLPTGKNTTGHLTARPDDLEETLNTYLITKT